MIRDRLSWMRFFLGLISAGRRRYREHDPALPQPHDRDGHSEARDAGLRLAASEEGLHSDVRADRPMPAWFPAPKLCAIPTAKRKRSRLARAGYHYSAPAAEIWWPEMSRTRAAGQKDVDAPLDNLKIGGKVRYRGQMATAATAKIATPVFGYKSHISIDPALRVHSAGEVVTSAAAPDGRQLKRLVAENTSSESLGRQRLSFAEEREMAGRPDDDEPHPSPQSRSAGRCPRADGRRPTLKRSRSVRSRGSSTCSAHQKMALRPVHFPDHWLGTGRGQADLG